MSHYDADIGIASLDLDGCGATQVFAEEHEWGLLLRARTDDRVVGVEIWRASERLPGELLVALPAPAAEEIIVGRQRA